MTQEPMNMKTCRFTNEQKELALRQAESGGPCRRGVPQVDHQPADVLPLEKKFGGIGVEEHRRLKTLEEQNVV